jgi:hypothetical protein
MFNKTLMATVIFLFLFSFSYSQEVKFTGTLAGFGWVKTSHSKRIALIGYYDFTYEKQFMDSWAWRVGLGASHVQYEGSTDVSIEYFREKSFLILPVLVRKYYPLSRQSVTYVETGIINKYEVTDKIDYDSDIKADEKFKSGGYIADMSVSVGFKTRLANGVAIDIGFGGQRNLFASYKRTENKIKLSATLLSLSISKKFPRFKKLKR